MKQFYIYILANQARMLYVGVTNDLKRRIDEHKQKTSVSYTARYSITRLVYFEMTLDVKVAIAREKQIKGWLRAKKIALITSHNPNWDDLSLEWFI